MLGSIVLVVFYAPLLMLQSRRFGQLTWRRSIADVMFAIYLAALVAYTLLPLPDLDWCADHEGTHLLLRPFHSIDDILTAGSARTTAVLQVVFNVVLFVPLGAFLRRHVGISVAKSTFVGLLTSVLIECTQATGIWGIYDCSYRWADIDDVLTNTTGALIGALLAPLFLGWLTPPAQEARIRRQPRPVTRSRRFLGMLIDFGLYLLVSSMLVITFRAFAAYGLEWEFSKIDASWGQWLMLPLTWLLLFSAPLLDETATPGQRAVWLRPTEVSRGPLRRARRSLTGLTGWIALRAIAELPTLAGTSLAELADAIAYGFALVCVAVLVFDRSARGLSLRAAGLGLEDSRSSGTENHRDITQNPG